MKFLISSLFAIFYLAFVWGCKREATIGLPVVETYPPSGVTAVSAIAAGNVTAAGGGNIIERGIFWGETPDLPSEGEVFAAGSGMGEFQVILEGLEKQTTYYVCAFAVNEKGMSTGEVISFTTTLFTYGDGVTDRDGNFYKTIIAGDQEWMAENLVVSNYRNGDPVPNITDGAEWDNISSGAFVYYENNYNTRGRYYGALYNWYAVSDERGLCPIGWRVPGEEDWDILVSFVGGGTIAGGGMKSKRTFPDLHPRWNEPNEGATNISGISGLPAGYRERHGTFQHLGIMSFWWSADEHGADGALAHNMVLKYYSRGVFRLSSYKQRGCSIRCIKDPD